MNYIWSLKIILFILFSIFILAINGRTSNEVRKTLADGSKIIGRYQTSFMGREILAFVGIPYAEPPIGELRFKAPVPKTRWTEPLMTIKDSNKCMQLIPFQVNLTVDGSEDCLYLNVFTPLATYSTYFPVMVFFHGGGWMANSGSSKEYAPDYLLDHDIVLVTANFRLGPLGFLSTGTRDCTGNFGIKDQLLVLKWVQKNIEIFNGNPNCVTVFGVDAGAASITYLMESARAKGLIHRAIIQSGVNMNPWGQPAMKGVSSNRTKNLALHINCKLYGILETEWHEAMNCLRRLSAESLTVAFYELYRNEFDPMIPFTPVIESEGYEAIITEDPRYAINTHGRTIPIIIGMNTGEGAMNSAIVTHSRNLMVDLQATWKESYPYNLSYKKKIRDRVADVYFANKIRLDNSTTLNLTNLYTDNWFLAGIDEYLRKRLLERYARPAGPTFVYLFSHNGSASYTETGGGRENYYGVCHGDELRALFPVDDHLFISSIPTDTDTTVRIKMTKMWVNFAYSGDPTPNHELGFKWYRTPPIIPINYLRIGNQKSKRIFQMENGLLDERAKLFYDLQPHLPPDEWLQCAN